LNYKIIETINVYALNLKESPIDIWNRISSNKRKNVKKAEREGVIVENSRSEEDFQSFLSLWKATATRANFDPKLKEVEEVGRAFRQKGSGRVFLAKWKHRDIAGTFIINHADTAYCRYAGSIEGSWSARPNDIVHWKAMEWACEQGYSWYHMGPVPEPEPSEGSPLWGLWRWKRGWGGILDKVSIYAKVYFPKLKGLMDFSRRMVNTSSRLTLSLLS